MRHLFAAVKAVSLMMYWISCTVLVTIVGLTVLDVTLRKFGRPIDFTFEIVVFLAAIVIGFALPQTSLEKGHVVMDFLSVKLSQKWRRLLYLSTRWVGVITFAIIGWNIMRIGNHLLRMKQVSPILEIPEFPVAYGVGACCFVECLVLVFDFMQNSKEAGQ